MQIYTNHSSIRLIKCEVQWGNLEYASGNIVPHSVLLGTVQRHRGHICATIVVVCTDLQLRQAKLLLAARNRRVAGYSVDLKAEPALGGCLRII